jgi:hypothetical protein
MKFEEASEAFLKLSKLFLVFNFNLSLSSGFLLAYAFFEKQKKKPSTQLTLDVLKGIVYRYLRIAPCFMIVSNKINLTSSLRQFRLFSS